MSEILTNVSLTDRQLMLLDGKVDDKTQGYVDKAKERLALGNIKGVPDKFQEFTKLLIQHISEKGKLTKRSADVSHCQICDRRADYDTYSRTSRHHRKGETNYDKRIYLRGVELAEVNVIFTGLPTLGMCNLCYTEYEPILLNEVLPTLVGEFSTRLTNKKPEYTYSQHKHCTKCNWNGHELEMGRLPTLMGDGFYYGVCPNCKERNAIFSSTIIETVPGFELVKVKTD